MRQFCFGVAYLILLAGCSSQTVNTRPPTADKTIAIPSDLEQHIQRAESIGMILFIADKVSAIATDVLAEKIGNLADSNLGGYLPIQDGDERGRPKDSWLVTFFTRDDPPKIAHRVRVFIKPGRHFEYEKVDPPVPAKEGLSVLIRARQAAIKALPEVVQPINPVVVPGELLGKSGILVYLLAASTRPGVAVFGKHYRVLVDMNGTVKEFFPMSKRAIEMELRPPGETANPAFLLVSHIITDWPMETHVFVSLLNKITVAVMTDRGVWRVDGAKITLIKAESK
jgi:hypothetical protein